MTHACNSEAETILAWAVAGYSEYAAHDDLREPEAVKVATSAYRLDSDPVARFIADECIASPRGFVRSGELYAR